MKNTDETIICHVPIKFEILTSGKAKNEAKVIKQSLHSSLLGGRTASLVNVVSSSTDNAAKATSRVSKIKPFESNGYLGPCSSTPEP